MGKFKRFLSEFVSSERLTFDEDAYEDRGYIDAFIRAQNRGEGEYFSDEQLVISIQVRIC